MTVGSLWRAGATDEELDEVAALDAARAAHEQHSKELAARRYLITNRACQRQRYKLRAQEQKP